MECRRVAQSGALIPAQRDGQINKLWLIRVRFGFMAFAESMIRRNPRDKQFLETALYRTERANQN
jgi:hypothetical protein